MDARTETLQPGGGLIWPAAPGPAAPRPSLTRKAAAIRVLDVLLALALLLLLLPVFLLVAGVIRLEGPGPVLFSHRRIGRNGRGFGCLKFRTMSVDADRLLAELLARSSAHRLQWERDHKLRDDPRVTGIGAVLRRTSLDEIPQLFNVIRGEMSLVGPRPIVQAEVARYGRYYSDYMTVRPGVTGLWQISGRSDTSYRRRVALDVWYTRRCSVRLYLFIILRTPVCVAASRGSY